MSDMIKPGDHNDFRYSKIEDTEASIIKDKFERIKGQITKLAGSVGEESLRLHINSQEYINLPVHSKPYICFALSVSSSHNHVTIGSTHLLSPLYKSDFLTLFFDDNSTSKINFPLGGLKIGGEKHNYTTISDHQLLHICERKLLYVEVFNSKEKINVSYGFRGVPNEQYSTIDEGQYLLQIIAKRLMGIKLLLKNQ